MEKMNGQLLTLHGALDVLEYLSRVGKPARLSDISRDLGLPSSKVHRILSTLVSRNYVRRNPYSKLYSIGYSAWLLARSMDYAETLVDVTKPILDDLCVQAQETAFLSVIFGKSVLYLYTKVSPNPNHAFLEIGRMEPVHATASGKAMMAHLPNDHIEEIISNGLQKCTDQTIVDKKEFMAEFKLNNERGYALEKNEVYDGVSAIATAVQVREQQDIFGIGLLMPTTHLIEKGEDWFAVKLLQAKRLIIEKL